MIKAATIFTIAVMSLSASGYTQPPNRDRNADSLEIQTSIDLISRAYQNRDPAPFETLYLDRYISIRSKPVYNTRDQLIAMMKADAATLRARKKLEFETVLNKGENVQIRFFGNTAVATLARVNHWRYHESECVERTQQTEVWLRPEGTWQLAASHITTFPCDPQPPRPPLHPAVSAIPSVTIPPKNSDQAAETEINRFLNSVTSAFQSYGEKAAAVDRSFAEDFVSTDLEGRVSNRRNSLLEGLKAESKRVPGQLRESKAIQIFGDTAICNFRLRASRKIGPGDDTGPQVFTIVLVKLGGLWKIAASHVSSVDLSNY